MSVTQKLQLLLATLMKRIFPFQVKENVVVVFFFFNKPNRIILIISSNWMSKSDFILVLSFYVKLMSSD